MSPKAEALTRLAQWPLLPSSEQERIALETYPN